MSIFTILETILLGPLKLLFEVIFNISGFLLNDFGLAIVMLSLTMNILVLPLYRRADAMQEKARDTDAKLRRGVTHIKKTFTGDERMMILQTYYRQNHYKPTDALNGSVSLLLEIPFFMAAYQFLSHLTILDGVSLGPIQNLMAPDGLLVIGGMAINVLPILMTLINFLSSALYTRDFPLKTKIQLYAMALFFLVFLYDSPSGLVFYWTLNNLFSLVKNLFYRLKQPRKAIDRLSSAVGFILFGLAAVCGMLSLKRRIMVLLLGLLLQLPLLASLAVSRGLFRSLFRTEVRQVQPRRGVFPLGCVFLTLLLGLLIPSAVIAASPQEFLARHLPNAPLWYLVSSLCLAAGTFLVWLGVVYWLASPAGKGILTRLVWLLCGTALANYMFFGTRLGTISFSLQYHKGLIFSRKEILLNLLVFFLLALVLYVCITKWSRAAASVLTIAIVALCGMSALNLNTINDSLKRVDLSVYSRVPSFSLSTTGKNVVVLMLDRAMGEYIPYLFAEKPELKEQFSGFTYYDNTISFGGYTNFATPALFGGYEYTPVEMNRRNTETIVSKHNESLKVMPVLFSEHGYDVTVCEPVYANYQQIPDLSIFDEYPAIHTYLSEGVFSPGTDIQNTQSNFRNFFCFSVMKILPLCVQPAVYNHGYYHQVSNYFTSQTAESSSPVSGLFPTFISSYNVLTHLPEITTMTEEPVNTFLSMTNCATHEPVLLQTPDYVPAQTVDNREYDALHADRFTVDGNTLIVESDFQMRHYHVNMATMLRLGEWFDYLRENNVYDNTRIILVSDHGRDLFQQDQLIHGDGTDELKDVEFYYPLLMVKDFDQTGFTVSHEFMTNADVPTLATKDIIRDPQNPFTGNAINSDEKTAHEQFILRSHNWSTATDGSCTFVPARWASVKEDLWDQDNWTFYDEEVILSEHAAP